MRGHQLPFIVVGSRTYAHVQPHIRGDAPVMVGGFQLIRVGPDVHLRVGPILRHTGDALALPFAVLFQPQYMPVPGGILILAGDVFLPSGIQHAPLAIPADSRIAMQQRRSIPQCIVIRVVHAINRLVHSICYQLALQVDIAPLAVQFHGRQVLVIEAPGILVDGIVQQFTVCIGKHITAGLGYFIIIIIGVAVAVHPFAALAGEIFAVHCIHGTQRFLTAHHTGAFAHLAAVDIIGPG